MHTCICKREKQQQRRLRQSGTLLGWPLYRSVNHLSKLISFLIEQPKLPVPLQVICLERQGNAAPTFASSLVQQSRASWAAQPRLCFKTTSALFTMMHHGIWCTVQHQTLLEVFMCTRGSFYISIPSSRHNRVLQ